MGSTCSGIGALAASRHCWGAGKSLENDPVPSEEESSVYPLQPLFPVAAVVGSSDLLEIILAFAAGEALTFGPQEITAAFRGVERSCTGGRWLILEASLVSKTFRSASHTLFSKGCTALAFPPVDVVNTPRFHPTVDRSLKKCIDLGLTMSCAPPSDSGKALRHMVESMSLSRGRFAAIEEIHLANHDIDDTILTDLAGMLPSLKTMTLFGATLSQKGLKALFSECRNISRLFLFCCAINPMDILSAGAANLANLEKILIVDGHPDSKESVHDATRNDCSGISIETLEEHGLSACSECGCWYKCGSSAETCLIHPGTYKGYGSSCSSYDCCTSMKPGYPSTPGCVWAAHKPATSVQQYTERPLRLGGGRLFVVELYDVPFPVVKPLLWGNRFWLRDSRETRFSRQLGLY